MASLALLWVALLTPPAAAQAWVSPAGEGSVTLVTQMIDHVRRLADDGSAHEVAQFANLGLAVEIEYALTDRWSVSAFLPYIFGKYPWRAASTLFAVPSRGFLPLPSQCVPGLRRHDALQPRQR